MILPCLLALLLGSPAGAQVLDDSDLSGPASRQTAPALYKEGREEGGRLLFTAEALPAILPTRPALRPVVYGKLLLTDPQGRELPARGVKVLLITASRSLAEVETNAEGDFDLPIPAGAGGTASVRFRLENARWSLQQPKRGRPYEWEAATVQLPPQGSVPAGTFRLQPGTENGKVGFIHLQFLEALDLFSREGVPLGWWKKQLKVNYPGSADFFAPGAFSLDLTKAEAWDVNLHELGHAMMAAGTRSFGGGGLHKIDECYNAGLAWSEGFATFFAAAVRLKADDPDARFEYLVPRRAPIRIENVPEDVCRGDANEWRVAAGLWDLYDGHADGADGSQLGFQRMWKALEDKRMGGFQDAWSFLQKALQPGELAGAVAALRQNTLLAPPPVARPPAALRFDPGTLARPDWDGQR